MAAVIERVLALGFLDQVVRRADFVEAQVAAIVAVCPESLLQFDLLRFQDGCREAAQE